MNNRHRLVNRLKERNNKTEKLNELKRRAALYFPDIYALLWGPTPVMIAVMEREHIASERRIAVLKAQHSNAEKALERYRQRVIQEFGESQEALS